MRAAVVAALLFLAAPSIARAQNGQLWTTPDVAISLTLPAGWTNVDVEGPGTLLMITPATFGSDDLRVCSLREQAARPGGPSLRQDELNLILDRWSQDWLSARNFDTLHGHSSDTLSGVHVFSSDAERGTGERAERDLQRAFNLANSESGVIYLLTCRIQTVTSNEERLEEVRTFLSSLAINTGTTQ